jgi:hypothetical protein
METSAASSDHSHNFDAISNFSLPSFTRHGLDRYDSDYTFTPSTVKSGARTSLSRAEGTQPLAEMIAARDLKISQRSSRTENI